MNHKRNNEKQKLFVYGTLKSGFGNNSVFLRGFKGAPSITKDPAFDMRSNGMFPAVFPDGDKRIIGELYEVDPVTLGRIDNLEGNGFFYTRHEFPITTEDGDEVKSWMYVIDEGRDRWGNSYIKEREFQIGESFLTGLSFERDR